MNLQPIHPPEEGQRLCCVGCGRMFPASELKADLDGKPFVDYYCVNCANEVTRERSGGTQMASEDFIKESQRFAWDNTANTIAYLLRTRGIPVLAVDDIYVTIKERAVDDRIDERVYVQVGENVISACREKGGEFTLGRATRNLDDLIGQINARLRVYGK